MGFSLADVYSITGGYPSAKQKKQKKKALHEPSARGKSIGKAVHQRELDHSCKASKAACKLHASKPASQAGSKPVSTGMPTAPTIYTC